MDPNAVADFTGQAATNATPANTTPPVATGATVNGTTLTVRFSRSGRCATCAGSRRRCPPVSRR